MARRSKGAAAFLRVTIPEAPPRFILIWCGDGSIFGGAIGVTGQLGRIIAQPLTPMEAADLIPSLGVARDDPAATFDVYRAAPDYSSRASGAEVERDCEYVATLARIYPACCLCGGPMEIIEMWDYGHPAEPVAEGRCCAACYGTTVFRARKAALDAKLAAAIEAGRLGEVELLKVELDFLRKECLRGRLDEEEMT